MQQRRCGAAMGWAMGIALGLGAALPTVAWSATVELTAQEQAYVARHPEFTLCVDPDWEPFEVITPQGQHHGIAADLVRLVAERVGLRVALLPVSSWEESLAASKAGRCQAMSFLNDTPERRQWLRFTAPLFSDPNVIITREEHPYITDLQAQPPQRVALPSGTMVAERLLKDYPQLTLIGTTTEEAAMQMVSDRQADMTVRSLIVAAYTIKKQGFFNLKIAGQIPSYTNQLSVGVLKDRPELLGILDKGVRSITAQEREAISNRHVSIEVRAAIDYRLVWGSIAAAALLLLGTLFWARKLRALDQQRLHLAEARVQLELQARQEQSRLVAMLSHEVRTPLALIDGAAESLALTLPESDEPARLRLKRIRAGVQRIVGLTDQFLDRDRLEDTSLQLRLQPVKLGALLADIAQQLDAAARIEISVQGNDTLTADPDLLAVAVRNLLKNATLYSPAHSPISVQLHGTDQAVVLRVSNLGHITDPQHPQGLQALTSPPPTPQTAKATPARQPRQPAAPSLSVMSVFGQYVRGAHHPGQPGSGLGLYLAKRVVELHHGSLTLSCNDGTTVEFTATLPRGAAALPADPAA